MTEHSIFTKSRQFDVEKGSETIAYVHTPKLIEYYRTYRPHGLEYNVSWLWGHFEEVNTGTRYVYCREYKVANSNFVIITKVNFSMDTDDERIYDQPGDVFMGYTNMKMDPEKGKVNIAPLYPVGIDFNIDIAPQHIKSLDAGGRMDLDWNAIAPALYFYVPGHFGVENDILYSSEHYTVEGTVEGRKVKGWGGLDQSWNPPGVDYRQNKIIGALEKIWPVFYNEYEDGSFEGGTFVRGVGEHKALIYHKNGEARICKDIQVKIDNRQGFIDGMKFKIDEMNFEWKTESRATTATGVANDAAIVVENELDDTDWILGRMINLDEKKKVVKAYGTCEYFPNRCRWSEQGFEVTNKSYSEL